MVNGVTNHEVQAGIRETWLASNRRAFVVALLVPALLAAASAAVVPMAIALSWRIVAGICGLFSLLVVVSLGLLARQPRLAYHQNQLLVYLGSRRPQSVPIEMVEVFFLGQAASMVGRRGDPDDDSGPATSTIVVRLAQRADEWHWRDVRPMLGHWCDGYITIRGTWCEPISEDLIRSLNHRLVEIHRQQKQLREDDLATGEAE